MIWTCGGGGSVGSGRRHQPKGANDVGMKEAEESDLHEKRPGEPSEASDWLRVFFVGLNYSSDLSPPIYYRLIDLHQGRATPCFPDVLRQAT